MWADSGNRAYAIGIARAFGGAVIFGLPLLMTMEMWSLGVTTHPLRLLLFLLLNLCILIALSRFGGFEHTHSLPEDLLDALAAYAVGIIAAAAVLGLFGLVRLDTPINELVGMVAVQSVPASFGAMLARKRLSADQSEEDEDQEARADGYGGQLFLMLAGALFLAFNMASTEEIRLIGFKMSPWHSLAMLAASILVLHALVYAVGLAGQKEQSKSYRSGRLFLAFTVPGYGIAAIVSLYILWTFGSIDGASLEAMARSMVVLGFPAAVGAAVARLVV
ncbi:TIGR02587 family membrane protein [Sphingobium sp. AS12]|uniref:TIGR02587 family membrane protein n=1 Tax=Sphingobium sp. AS12 TaxID=2849495 RepID=UPI002675651C|nr:TIGR02587 family membrane protein [Sphingobium sp. AS12]